MVSKILATNPDGTSVQMRYSSESLEMVSAVEESGTLIFTVATKFDRLRDAQANGEALQEGAKVEWLRNTTNELVGWVVEMELVRDGERRWIEYLIEDDLARIRETAAHQDGKHIFQVSTPDQALNIVPLQYRGANVFDEVYEYWPDPTSLAYLPMDSYAIVAHGPGNSFIITGDSTKEMYAGVKVTVANATENNAVFTVVTAVFGAGSTTVTVSETVDAAGFGGDMSSEFRTSFTTLSQALAIGATEVRLDALYRGIPAKGIMRIGSEYVPYDGYAKRDDGFWWANNLVRGGLGSAAAAHLSGDLGQDLTPQKIHPAGDVFLEGEPTASPGTWESINQGQFTVQPEEGRIDFGTDPAKIYVAGDMDQTNPRQGFNKFRLTYHIYAELDPAAVTLGGFANDILTANADGGGPALSAARLDIDIPSIRLTGVLLTKPTHTIDVLDDLRVKLGFEGNGDVPLISNWFDSAADVYRWKTIVQKGQEDHQFYFAEEIQERRTLQRIYSGVIAPYREGANRNLLSASRMFGPVIGELVGSNNQPVNSVLRQFVERDTAAGWTEGGSPFTAYPGGYTDEQKQGYFKETMFDALKSTGFGLQWNSGNNPGSNIRAMSGWFSAANDPFVIDRIRALIDFRRNSNSANPIDFRIVGHRAYTPPVYSGAGALLAPPVIGSEVPLAGSLHARYPSGGVVDTDDQGAVELLATRMGASIRAISVMYEGLNRLDGGEWRFTIKELEANGYSPMSVFVQLQDEAAGAWTFDRFSSQAIYDLIRDTNFNYQKILILDDIGIASFNSAVSLARLALVEAQQLNNQRVYVVVPKDRLPQRGETVWIAPDNFRGVVLGTQANQVAGGAERLSLRLADLSVGAF